jgi:hypothetical protein
MAMRLSAAHGSEVVAMAYAVAMAWRIGCRHRMAWRLLPWHGGCRHGTARRLSPWHGSETVAMARLGGCRHGMAWRLPASHGLEVAGISWHGGCLHGIEVVAMAWLMLLPWHGV